MEMKKVYHLENPIDLDKLIFSITSQISKVQTSIGMKEAFFSKQYRFSSWNAVILGQFQQFTGISGVLLFQTKIFLKMQQQGQFNIPIMIAVQYVNLFNLIASLCSGVPISRLGQRKALLIGQFSMVAFLGGIVVSSILN
jgi:hypothetical protein